MRSVAAIAFTLSCVVVAACSGGGGRLVPATQNTAAPAKAAANASFTIHVPSKTAGTSAKPQYVSPSTTQVSISVNGGAAVVAPLSPTASGCTSASNGFTCTVIVAAPVGTDTFVISLLDADSNVLSTLSVSESVASGAANNFGIVLGGVVASLTLTLATSSPVANGSAQQIALTVNGLDADGNVIAGPGNYNAPITITDSDTSGTTSLSVGGSTPATTISVTAPGSSVTVNYTGAALPSGATFTASVSGTSVTPESVKLTPTSGTSTTVTLAISGSPAALAYSTGTSGTWTPVPSGATSFALSGTTAYGVAYMCGTGSGNVVFVQATTAELSTVPVNCGSTSSATLNLTFDFASSSFCSYSPSENASIIDVDGQSNNFTACASSPPANPTSLDAGTQDVFAMAITASPGDVPVALKTLQGASVPGSATMTFTASDAVSTATMPTLTQVPATMTSTLTQVNFGSFNYWPVPLTVSNYNAGSTTEYYTVASGDIGTNDSYFIVGYAGVSGPGTANEVAGDAFAQSVPTSVTLPSPFNETYTAAGSPAFATAYTFGTPIAGNVSGYYFDGNWYGTGIPTNLSGFVTLGFVQAGSLTAYTMPNIAVSGFPPTVAPGSTSYEWRADTFSVPSAFFAILPVSELALGFAPQVGPTSGPTQGSMFFAQAQGGFTVP